MTYELPEVEYIDADDGKVIVAAAIYVPAAVCGSAWWFLFRGTTPTKFGAFARAWYDWQIMSPANDEGAAILRLRQKAAERMMIKIEILSISDPATRAALAARREDGKGFVKNK